MRNSMVAFCGVLLLIGPGLAGAAGIQGDYVEARTADVFTGPCISNSEVFISGDQAVMAWKVSEGSFQGVDLAGLSVAAAVRGSTTFSKDRPEEARAVLIVDERANPAQRAALVALATTLGGARLQHVAEVKTAAIRLMVERHATPSASDSDAVHAMPHAPRASFWAAGLAQVLTRPLDDRDHFCGNEVVAYAPLSDGVTALPAYTLGHEYKGTGLDVRWDDPNCRSAFVGRFAL